MDDLRPLLLSIAYRMLGSLTESEDVVQEAYLRRQTAGDVESERAFMTTVTTRLAIDALRSARHRREVYVGSWLPEPLVDPEAPVLVEHEETVSLGFLLLLERLTPVERAVLVLRDAFELPFAEIAAIVERSEDNCRQIASRARRRIADERPRFDAAPEARDELAGRFLAAARDGDVDGLVAVLARDAALVGDGGGRARSIPRPMRGAPAIAQALVAFHRQGLQLGARLVPARVNGQPGFRSLDPDGRVINVVGLEIEGGAVRAIYSQLNPDKLRHLGPVSDLGLRPSARA